MPELPEVETTCRGIAPHILHRKVTKVVVREARLRWPVPERLHQLLSGSRFISVSRRAKYLLLETDHGILMVHLGMSGSLRILPATTPPMFHDHVDILLDDGRCLLSTGASGAFTGWARRRFSTWVQSVVWGFHRAISLCALPGRRVPVKQFVMDGKIVVGVGNIYANEALFMSGIHPIRAAGRIGQARYEALADAIKTVLGDAIAQGGTTLRDFVGGDGAPGYFAQQLRVYGRDGQPCRVCQNGLKEIRRAAGFVLCTRCRR